MPSRPAPAPQLRLTRRGFRITCFGHVISEGLREPGPTDSIFDLLAAAAVVLTPGPRLGVLGLGGGGVVAPLRSLGHQAPLVGVDLDPAGPAAFRRHAPLLARRVRMTLGDALVWLRRQRRPFDALIEDLSVARDGDLVMPPVCFEGLPRMLSAALGPSGVAIVSAFSPPGGRWTRHLERLRGPFPHALVIVSTDFDNRILALSRRSLSARDTSHRLRRALGAIGSSQANRFHVRSWR